MRVSLLLLPLLLLATTARAQNSAPRPVPIAETIPAARDTPYPGTIRLEVDASDTRRGILQVRETIPVAAPGRLTLLYPQWLPGNHSPAGPIDKLAGIGFTAGGGRLAWVRDAIDVYAFHVDVPAGTSSIEARFQYLAATAGDQGRITITDDLLNLQWNSVVLYPAGHFARAITVEARVTYPAGWTSATALGTNGPARGPVAYPAVSLDTLVDSPVFAGRHARIEMLDRDVTLALFADRPEQLAATPDQLRHHRDLVVQADRLFGARHFDRYTFLFALSDQLGRVGLEHHRSSENAVPSLYFTDWAASLGNHDLLPHEYVHSWNGKYRRPADLWTPDFRVPMQDSLLWVYEGQTQFWGNVLAARAGLVSLDDALGALAQVAAQYDTRAGRSWRPLADTTNDPIIADRRPQGWTSWQRSEDYYQEGQLIWLEADQLIRERSQGRRSLDDFARSFFGMRPGDWGQLTYTRADVIAALNAVEPYDWTTFLRDRIDQISSPRAPLAGIEKAGYRLAYTDLPTAWWTTYEKARKRLDLSYSLGLTVGKDGQVTGVTWDGPAFDAGLTVGAILVAIDGRAYSDDALKAAIVAAKAGTPIKLLIKQDDRYRDVSVKWTGGLRYPTLEKIGKGPSTLEALLAPKR